MHRDFREDLIGVHRDVLIARDGRREVEAIKLQPVVKGTQMVAGGDDDDPFPALHPAANECLRRIEQCRILFIYLHHMFAGADLAAEEFTAARTPVTEVVHYIVSWGISAYHVQEQHRKSTYPRGSPRCIQRACNSVLYASHRVVSVAPPFRFTKRYTNSRPRL